MTFDAYYFCEKLFRKFGEFLGSTVHILKSFKGILDHNKPGKYPFVLKQNIHRKLFIVYCDVVSPLSDDSVSVVSSGPLTVIEKPLLLSW